MNPQRPMPGVRGRGRGMMLALLSQSTIGGGYSQPAASTSSAKQTSRENASHFQSPGENIGRSGQGN